MDSISVRPHHQFELERSKKSQLFPHALSADRLVLFNAHNDGWSMFRSVKPKPVHQRVYAYIIEETPDHIDIQTIFPHQLTMGSGPTIPMRFFRLMKVDKTIKYFRWSCQDLRRPLSDGKPRHASVAASWELLGSVADEECTVCVEKQASTLTRCGHRFCGDCCSKLDECPICRQKWSDKSINFHDIGVTAPPPDRLAILDKLLEQMQVEVDTMATMVADLTVLGDLMRKL